MQKYISKVKNKDGISILKVHGSTPGVELAKREIYKIIDERTALFLSGGSTPKHLYQILTKEKKLKVGAVAMVDERFLSEKLRTNNEKLNFTNEKMIKDAGLLSYLESENIPFYGILKNKSLEETARDYDKVVQGLFKKFQKRVAILGIGEDGHIAGLPSGKSQISNLKSQKYVTDVKNFPGEFRERISLTFHALSKMDLLILLVFGKEKKKALKLLFSEGSIPIKSGSIAKVPARFLNTPEISEKTLLITNQKV